MLLQACSAKGDQGSAIENAHIIDQHIETAKLIDHLSYAFFYLALAGNVALVCKDSGAQGQILQGLLVNVKYGHPGSACQELVDYLQAKPTCAAGDQTN